MPFCSFWRFLLPGLPDNKVCGMAGVLDGCFRHFLARNSDPMTGWRLRSGCDGVVPLVRYSTVGGIPLPDLADGPGPQEISAPSWVQMRGFADVEALAKTGSAFYAPRPWRNYSTAVGEALFLALDQKRVLPAGCTRRVIDLSGDGFSNEGVPA